MALFDSHANFAYSTVVTAPTPATTGTSLIIQTGDGALFPAVPFNCVVWPANSQPLNSNAEVVRVTNVSTDTFTITRNTESSTARSIIAGDQICLAITAKALTDIEADLPTFEYFANDKLGLEAGVTTSMGQSTSILIPMIMHNNYSFNYLRLLVSASAVSTTFVSTSNSQTATASVLSTINAVLYSLGNGANSNSLQYIFSTSQGVSQQWSFSESSSSYTMSWRLSYPINGTTTSFSTSFSSSSSQPAFSTGSLSNFNGIRFFDIPFATSLTPGAYFLMLGVSSTTSTAGYTAALVGGRINMSTYANSQSNLTYGALGVATASSQVPYFGVGSFTTAGGGTTSSLDLSNISSMQSHPIVYVQGIGLK